jgi:hypothetical protein
MNAIPKGAALQICAETLAFSTGMPGKEPECNKRHVK